MPEAELRAEIAAGVDFWSYEAEGRLWGVMGGQDLMAVTLIRHAYVDPGAQRRGVGSRLLNHLLNAIPAPVLVGTWAAADWAIRFYQKHGFEPVPPAEKNRLLRTYWTISPRQSETSVVLADPKLVGARGQGLIGKIFISLLFFLINRPGKTLPTSPDNFPSVVHIGRKFFALRGE
jgi:N-acetylglutamate synthase-like GNAT family acetyltransferase